jgi:hypothetical protein
MKWIGGVVLIIITIVFLIMAVFMFPWFSTKTNYNRDNIAKHLPEDFWEDHLGGVERDWDESTYFLQSCELRSGRPLNWSKTSTSTSTTSGMLYYNSQPSAGGWDGSYEEINASGYPVPGFLVGGAEQLSVYNYTYYFQLIGIIMAILSVILIIIAGMDKIGLTAPRVLVILTIIFIVISVIYFALFLPMAIEKDSEEIYNITTSTGNATDYVRPPEATGIWGKANTKVPESTEITSTVVYQPGFGWWFAVVGIFTSIFSLAFIGSPKSAEDMENDSYSRRKYHELDAPYNDDYSRDYQDDRDYRYDDRYQNNDYHQPQRRSRRAPPPPSHDFGRPTPRPPRRRSDYPPARSRGRRPPGRY